MRNPDRRQGLGVYGLMGLGLQSSGFRGGVFQFYMLVVEHPVGQVEREQYVWL